MSLIKQLWLAILSIILVCAGGIFILSMLSTQAYLTDQIQMKNTDNVTILALSMSQLEKEPTTISLLISAQFNAGHYQFIKLTDPDGNIISEFSNLNHASLAPRWFIKLLPITTQPVSANIQDGWQQYGTLSLASDVNFAYDELWSSAKTIALWSIVIGLLSCILGAQLLKYIASPLENVINQAKAIENNQFITIAEPKTKELRALVSAMNQLSVRIKQNTEEALKRLQSLNLKSNFDLVTGIMNRSSFSKLVDALVTREDYSNQGVLIIVRLVNLAKVNPLLGYQHTNDALKQIALTLNTAIESSKNKVTGRISGTDFGLFYPEKIDGFVLASTIKQALGTIQFADFESNVFDYLFLAINVKKAQDIEHIYTEAERLLTQNASILDETNIAEHNILNVTESVSQTNERQNNGSINQLFHQAISNKRIKLEHYPVLTLDRQVIHYECPVRLQLEAGGIWLTAGEFLNTALELNLVNQIDQLVLDVAIESLHKTNDYLSINISASGISSPTFTSQALSKLANHQAIAHRLCFEVPEVTAYAHLESFKSFCKSVKKLNCKVAVEHVGIEVSRLAELQEIGIDFIKIDQSLIRDIQSNTVNKTLLNGLCTIAHSLGIQAIAEGVRSENEIKALKTLGLDGLTGPIIKT